MRLVCAAATAREDLPAARFADAYIVKDTLDAVSLRLSAGEGELDAARALLTLPDGAFARLMRPEADEPLSALLDDVRQAAAQAEGAHPENELYTQLAQSLSNWCALIEQTEKRFDGETARQYAAVTMCTLCRELRNTLLMQAQ